MLTTLLIATVLIGIVLLIDENYRNHALNQRKYPC